MQKYNAFSNVFFVRDKKEWAKCYERVDFWVTILAGVCLLLSFVLARYVNGSGGTTYSQMWTGTGANWALVMCGLVTGICGIYIMVINLVFKNSAMLSGINIALGIFIAIMFVMEYMVLKKVGFKSGDTIVTMSNSAGIGFYLGIVGALMFAGLEFYKLGAQGYYTAEEYKKEKSGNGVQIVDGVVVVDGEAVTTNNDNENETILEQSQVVSDSSDEHIENEQPIEKPNDSEQK